MKLLRKPDPRLLILTCALYALHLRAQDLPTRFPVSASAVMTSLQKAGVSIDPAQIQMPQNLTATSSDVALRIAGAELLSDGRFRVRFACQDLGACQPFFVTASLAPGTGMATVAALRATTSGEKRSSIGGPALIRAGGQAQMFLQDEHMWITIPVLTIDTGAAGAEVRVTSLDHKQTFRAFVVSPGVVRGVLQ